MGTMGHETDSASMQRILQHVAHFYEAEVDWETHIERRFVEGFLQTLATQGADAETCEAAWETIRFLVWYLDHLGPEITGLETLRAYHFSELITDFTDRKVLGRPSANGCWMCRTNAAPTSFRRPAAPASASWRPLSSRA